MEPLGRVLGDRYRLVAPLASGGMGRVWRALDLRLDRPVAVKVLRSEFADDPTFRARFRAEAQHAGVLQHPNIAAVFDYGETVHDGECVTFLAMELVEGEPLSDLLAREGSLDPDRTLRVLEQTADGLAAAHDAGLVHRDVKPGNLMVRDDGVVKITDFGIAWSAASTPLTQAGQVLGTAYYLSPEQAAGGRATPASDVYALGAVAYECLTGQRPIDGESSVQIALNQIRATPEPLPPHVPAGIGALVERAMDKDPNRRFCDGAALRDAVTEVRENGGAPRATTAVLDLPAPTTLAVPVAPRRPGPRRRSAARRALLAAVAVVAVLGSAGLFLQREPPTSAAGGAPASTTVPADLTTGPPVPLVAAEHIGRHVADVQADLVAQGLLVLLAPVASRTAGPGEVTALTPEGALPRGSVVTVFFAVEQRAG